MNTALASSLDAGLQRRRDVTTISTIGVAHGTSHFFHMLLPPLFPAFIQAFGLSYSELGLLVTTFFVISGAGQAASGFIVDRIGARPVLFAAMVSFFLASGLVLPAPLKAPAGVVLPFQPVKIIGSRAVFSGHGPVAADGSLAQPLGKVGRELSIEQGIAAARVTGLAIFSSLERALGDLDRITAWTRVFGMVNSAPGFNRQPTVINGFSDLLIAVFGPVIGAHTRSAVGMFELPFDIPVEIEGEVEIR